MSVDAGLVAVRAEVPVSGGGVGEQVPDEAEAWTGYPDEWGCVATVTTQQIRELTLSLPRTTEHLIRDHVKFRVGSLVYVSISPDERVMGLGYPKEERLALIAAEPEKFYLPAKSDERYNWVRAWLAALDHAEMTELVIDAWRMVVPKKVAAAHLLDRPR